MPPSLLAAEQLTDLPLPVSHQKPATQNQPVTESGAGRVFHPSRPWRIHWMWLWLRNDKVMSLLFPYQPQRTHRPHRGLCGHLGTEEPDPTPCFTGRS